MSVCLQLNKSTRKQLCRSKTWAWANEWVKNNIKEINTNWGIPGGSEAKNGLLIDRAAAHEVAYAVTAAFEAIHRDILSLLYCVGPLPEAEAAAATAAAEDICKFSTVKNAT